MLKAITLSSITLAILLRIYFTVSAYKTTLRSLEFPHAVNYNFSTEMKEETIPVVAVLEQNEIQSQEKAEDFIPIDDNISTKDVIAATTNIPHVENNVTSKTIEEVATMENAITITNSSTVENITTGTLDVMDIAPDFTWEDINNYNLEKFLGNGTFGDGWRATKDGKEYLLKIFKKPLAAGWETKSRKREIDMYKLLENCPNTVKLHGMAARPEDPLQMAFVMELINNRNTTQEVLGSLTKDDVRHYMYQMLETLACSQGQGIMHRDIKMGNLAFDLNARSVKVLDWGASTVFNTSKRYDTATGTQNFRAPEMLFNMKTHNPKVDSWAIGIILATMTFSQNKTFYQFYGNPFKVVKQINAHLGYRVLNDFVKKYRIPWPFEGESLPIAKRKKWDAYITDANRHRVSDEVLDLLDKLLTVDFEHRITAAEALLHPYFDPIREQQILREEQSDQTEPVAAARRMLRSSDGRI